MSYEESDDAGYVIAMLDRIAKAITDQTEAGERWNVTWPQQRHEETMAYWRERDAAQAAALKAQEDRLVEIAEGLAARLQAATRETVLDVLRERGVIP